MIIEEIQKGVNWIAQVVAEKIFEDKDEYQDFVIYLEAFYTLYISEHPLFESDIKEIIDEDSFWASITFWSNPYYLYYPIKMNHSRDPRLLELVQKLLTANQSLEGYLKTNDNDHSGGIRIFNELMPSFARTELAAEFLAKNIELFRYKADDSLGWYFDSLAMGLIALHEYNPVKFSSAIDELTTILLNRFSVRGYIKYSSSERTLVKNSALALQALMKVLPSSNKCIQAGINDLKSRQASNGSWSDNILDTAKATQTLLLFKKIQNISD